VDEEKKKEPSNSNIDICDVLLYFNPRDVSPQLRQIPPGTPCRYTHTHTHIKIL